MQIQLFESDHLSSSNLLSQDGIVRYFGKILDHTESQHFFEAFLSTIEWKNDEALIFGNKITTKRKVAWYGDQPFSYTYSNTTKHALPWTKELSTLKSIIEQRTNETFNSCLLNLYHSGEEGMAYHSDAEKDLKPDGTIASVSLGADRKFSFKHKHTGETVSLFLENGSLLTMEGKTQMYWLHRLPPTKKVLSPRINLTFRTIVDQF